MDKKIKNVAILCHDFTLSGANCSLLDWIKTAKNNDKYNIICIIPRKGEKLKQICEDNGVEVIRGNYFVTVKHLYSLPVKEKIKNVIKNFLRICINPISFLVLKNKLKKRNIKLIHSNSFATTFGVKLAIKMNIPHVWHVREFMEEDHKITHLESEEKIKKYCEYSSAIFISDVIKNKYDNLFKNNFKKIIYDKVDFDVNYLKERKFCEDDCCSVLIAGTLSENKGQIEAIKAIEELEKKDHDKIKLFICGMGNDEIALKDYVKKHNLDDVIKFKGQVDELTNFRKNIDIALTCSKKEALGRVTVEAMYYNNLVIATNTGENPYIIKDNETGILYDCGDYKQLSDKIINAINDREKSIALIKEAQKCAIDKFYNIDYIKLLFNMYDEILTCK